MKSFLSLVVPALLSGSLFAAAPQAPRLPQAPAVSKAVESPETSTARNSPLSILVISKSGCVPCAHLAAELKAHGHNLKWDIWKNSPRMEAKYGGVTAYPTILLLRDGKEISRRVGYASVEELSGWMDDPTAFAGGTGEYCERQVDAPPPVAISQYYAPQYYAPAAFCQT